ncbi:Uncharacterised protein, partial [Mycoplasma putrefaciens]
MIQAFYKYQLLNANFNYIKQDVLDDVQQFKNQDVIDEIETIANLSEQIIQTIKPLLSSKW